MSDTEALVLAFGVRLRAARNVLNASEPKPVSHTELGRRVGGFLQTDPIVTSAVSRWGKETRPDLDTTLAIATVCGVDPGWLAYGDLTDASKPPLWSFGPTLPARDDAAARLEKHERVVGRHRQVQADKAKTGRQQPPTPPKKVQG